MADVHGIITRRVREDYHGIQGMLPGHVVVIMFIARGFLR